MRAGSGEVEALTPPLLRPVPGLGEVLAGQPVGLAAVRRGRGDLLRGVQAQQLAALGDAPADPLQVARVAVLLLGADRRPGPLAVAARALLGGRDLVGALGLLPRLPV